MRMDFKGGSFRVETVVKDEDKVCLEIEQKCDGQQICLTVENVETINSIIEELTWAKHMIQEKNKNVRKNGVV